MNVEHFVDVLEEILGIDAYFGVPDSLLRAFTDEVVERYGFGPNHVVAADEGGATALAAGHFLATGKPAVVYLQNSGIGNAVNPVCSLLNQAVYALPVLFVVGWRGEPGVHDEPQHVFQGACSERLLETVGLPVQIISSDTSEGDLAAVLKGIGKMFSRGESAALLVRKGALTRDSRHGFATEGDLSREEALAMVCEALPEKAAVVSTTGKLSRELFELRERRGASHCGDFLTVGSMGHSSMIGLGIALAQPQRPTVVFDGDGSCLMHAGALALVGERKPKNYVHFLFNNEAHESVGGMPTASSVVDWCAVALACGYRMAFTADDAVSLVDVLSQAMTAPEGPVFVEVRVNSSSRSDLGRPTTSARENGLAFAEYLQA